jgi:predicted transcriptional regulator of viral defense system
MEVFCILTRLNSMSASERAAKLFRQRGGIMRMADIIRAGITRNTLYKMRDAQEVEQLTRGLYRLADLPPLSDSDLVTVASKVPQGVIYLVSALAYHQLTTQIPHEIWIAIPRNNEPPKLEYPPVRSSRLSASAYNTGIEKHRSDGVEIRVYSREKTIVDCFNRRNEVGLDVALEALKAYMDRGQVKIDLLMKYAKKLRVAQTMRPYVEALL